MHSVFKVAAVAAAVAGILGGAAARADEDGSWEVRLRGVYLDPANKSDAIPALAVPENAIHINGKWLPDLDFEYFFTPNWSTELVLTYPQKQTVTVEQSALGGPTNIGTFKHLPPTLTAKYDFLPDQVFQPYVGLGVNDPRHSQGCPSPRLPTTAAPKTQPCRSLILVTFSLPWG